MGIYEYMLSSTCVNPEKALIAAGLAIIVGIMGYAWRHRKNGN